MPKDALFTDVAINICSNKGFTLHNFIDSGAFKETYHISSNQSNYALKVFNFKNANERSEREINAMKRLNSDNIAKLIEVDNITYNGNEYLFILEEYLGGGTLSSLLQHQLLQRNEILQIGSDIINALLFTYKINVVHRDIKPDNIMFRDDTSQAVLVDFGLVRDLNETSLTQAFIPRGPGTAYFSSPEQLTNKKAMIDWRSDQFSLGVTLCVALFGLHPFEKPKINETIDSVSSFCSCNEEIKKQLIGLNLFPIIKMLEPFPVKRYRTPDTLIYDWKSL